jgi:hypothetical protein
MHSNGSQPGQNLVTAAPRQRIVREAFSRGTYLPKELVCYLS